MFKRFAVRTAIGVPVAVLLHYAVDVPANKRVRKGELDPVVAFACTYFIGALVGVYIHSRTKHLGR